MHTNTLQTEEKIFAIINDVSNIKCLKLSPALKLKEDLAMDSLDILTVVSEIEIQFYIQIPDIEVEHLITVNDLVLLTVKMANPVA